MTDRKILSLCKTLKDRALEEYHKNEKTLKADKIGNLSLTARQIQLEQSIANYTQLIQTIEADLEPQIDNHANADVRKITRKTYEDLKYFETRLDLAVDEVCANIKIEYDEIVSIHPNPMDYGDVISTQLTITPKVLVSNIQVKYIKE